MHRRRARAAGDGPARVTLQQRASALGIASAVDFLGWIEPARIPDLINRASIVIIPSRWKEAFGLVALQAAQMSRPVIATRTGGLPEVVKDGVTGYLCPMGDVEAMAGRAIALLRDEKRARAMGHAARERAVALFGPDRAVHAHEKIYESLLAKAPHA